MLICAPALAVLWLFRRSVLDQWLMIVILAMIIELAITGLIGGMVHKDDLLPIDQTRVATLGFYIGRLFSLVTSTVILIALLAETSKLYAGVARANTLESVVQTSQAVSREIELPKLIERLMTIALRNAGADRGLLILPHQDDYRIEAEALADGENIVLRSRASDNSPNPETIVRHAIRTRERVILSDTAIPNPFSADPHLSLRRPRSVLCLPLVHQGTLGGLLYLENTPGATRLYAGTCASPGTAGFAGGDFAGERRPLHRSSAPGWDIAASSCIRPDAQSGWDTGFREPSLA
jgi:hypothetical protein